MHKGENLRWERVLADALSVCAIRWVMGGVVLWTEIRPLAAARRGPQLKGGGSELLSRRTAGGSEVKGELYLLQNKNSETIKTENRMQRRR